ncbi:putative ribonuclease H-like domain-containing protein [Tanacetum coccineum]
MLGKVIGIKWVFKNKMDERIIVVKNKARLVAQGFRQEEGVYYDECISLKALLERRGAWYENTFLLSDGKMVSKDSCKHNMVAFLKKPNESVGFTEVVDFLKGISLSVSKTKSTDKGKRYRRRARSMAKKINMKLDAEDKVNHGSRVEINLIHLDNMLAKRVEEEQELSKQQLKRKAEVQKAAQFYTEEDWDTIRAKLEANT